MSVLVIEKNNSFTRSMGLAVFIHLLLVAAIIIGKNYFTTHINKTNEIEEYIKSSVRVDIVAMPTLTQKEIKDLPLLDSISNSKETVKEIKAEAPRKVDLSNLLNSFSKRNKIIKKKPSAKKADKDESISNKKLKKLKGLLLEGNRVSKGTSKLGDSTQVINSEYNDYVSKLPSFVRPHWKLPSYLMGEGLKCRVRIFISKTGKILNKEVYQTSGNSEFDSRALKALDQTKTLPEPNESILSRLISGSVIMGFPL